VNRRNFNNAERKVVFRRHSGQCAICDIALDVQDKWHVDHVIPYDKGGKTILKNAQLLCPNCNLKKGNRMSQQQIPAWNKPLRKWQYDAFVEALEHFKKPNREHAFTLSAFPGSGKTTFALRVIHDWVSRPGKRFVVVVVPSSTLADQFYLGKIDGFQLKASFPRMAICTASDPLAGRLDLDQRGGL